MHDEENTNACLPELWAVIQSVISLFPISLTLRNCPSYALIPLAILHFRCQYHPALLTPLSIIRGKTRSFIIYSPSIDWLFSTGAQPGVCIPFHPKLWRERLLPLLKEFETSASRWRAQEAGRGGARNHISQILLVLSVNLIFASAFYFGGAGGDCPTKWHLLS